MEVPAVPLSIKNKSGKKDQEKTKILNFILT